jgi:hypothetical protein
MSIIEQALEALIVALIAGVSALVAIAATEQELPGLLDLYTVGLATALAFLVRFATLRDIEPPEG